VSDTPRTDAEMFGEEAAPVVNADFAAGLERELNEALSEVARLRGQRTAAEAIMTDVAEQRVTAFEAALWEIADSPDPFAAEIARAALQGGAK